MCCHYLKIANVFTSGWKSCKFGSTQKNVLQDSVAT